MPTYAQPKYIILAGYFNEFQQWQQVNDINPKEALFVGDTTSLQNLDGISPTSKIEVHVLPGFRTTHQRIQIIDVLLQRIPNAGDNWYYYTKESYRKEDATQKEGNFREGPPNRPASDAK